MGQFLGGLRFLILPGKVRKMPTISTEKEFDGAYKRIDRLGMRPILEELRSIVTGFPLLIQEKKHANGAAALRSILDLRFLPPWQKTASGGIDWRRCEPINGATVCLGVEVQVSARSDMLIVDVTHLRDAVDEGEIDVGVIVVPDDDLSTFLVDRTPRYSYALEAIRRSRAEHSPFLIWAIRHDGVGPALPKRQSST
jgi:hypothetical protein